MKKINLYLYLIFIFIVVLHTSNYAVTSSSNNSKNKVRDFDIQNAHADHSSDYQIFPSFYYGWDFDDSLECIDSSHALHPSIEYFPNKLWGYKYWVAYTPFCISESDENPHIAVSNDGIDWSEYVVGNDTLFNPLFDLNYFNATHLSDPDLCPISSTKMLLAFRASWSLPGKDSHVVFITVTENGYDWSPPIALLSDGILNQDNISTFISPSLIFSPESNLSVYVVEPRANGLTYIDTSRVVRYNLSLTDFSILSYDTIQLYSTNDTMKLWHLDIVEDNNQLLALVAESPNLGLNFGGSAVLTLACSNNEGDTWIRNTNVILSSSEDTTAWDGNNIYRSSGYWINNIQRNVLGLYYSASANGVPIGGTGTGWQTGYTYVFFDTSMEPIIDLILIDNNNTYNNIVNNYPNLNWHYIDPTGEYNQTQFEIAIGTDDDWAFAEIWNPATFVSADTFITYSGSIFEDGNTYYLRLRVHNGTAWSDWYNITFRMNSTPSIPISLYPVEDEVTNNTPMLWIENSFDPEGDSLTYDFTGFHDTDCVFGSVIDLQGIAEGSDSTGGQIIDPLGENCIYWWKARSYDGYEYSDWSTTQRIYIDGTPEPPTAFQAQFPPDTGNMPVFDMLTNFTWDQSYDGDPLDTVKYNLDVAIDSLFNFVFSMDSIVNNQFTLLDSLQFGTHYWWKVTAFDNDGFTTQSTNIPDFWTWMLGDVNHDHDVNVADLVYMVNYVFKGGTAIYPEFVGDIDHSCSLNVTDLVYMVNYIFKGGHDPLIGCD